MNHASLTKFLNTPNKASAEILDAASSCSWNIEPLKGRPLFEEPLVYLDCGIIKSKKQFNESHLASVPAEKTSADVEFLKAVKDIVSATEPTVTYSSEYDYLYFPFYFACSDPVSAPISVPTLLQCAGMNSSLLEHNCDVQHFCVSSPQVWQKIVSSNSDSLCRYLSDHLKDLQCIAVGSESVNPVMIFVVGKLPSGNLAGIMSAAIHT